MDGRRWKNLLNMSYNTEKSSLIHLLVVLALLLSLSLLATPVFWSFIAIIHIFALILQLIIKICTTSVEILLLVVRRTLRAGLSCTSTNGYREAVRNVNGVQMHFALTVGVGFGAHRFYSLVEERPKFRLQLYTPDEPEIMPRQEQSEMRMNMRSLPMYIRYRPHVPSSLGPNYIEEWKELIDFYLSKRYATEISDGPMLNTTKDLAARYRAEKTCGLSAKKVDFQTNGHNVEKLDLPKFPKINSCFNKARDKVIRQKRVNLSNLSPQETLVAARAQLKQRLRKYKK